MILAMTKAFGFEPSGHSKSHEKTFSISLPFARSKSQSTTTQPKMPLAKVKLQMELAIQDMEGQDVERMRYKIRGSHEVRQLWLIRSDVHQLIAKRINQPEAATRINALLPCFEGWVPKQSLTRI